MVFGARKLLLGTLLGFLAVPSPVRATHPKSRCLELLNSHIVLSGGAPEVLVTRALTYSHERARLTERIQRDDATAAELFELAMQHTALETAQRKNLAVMSQAFLFGNAVRAHMADHYQTNTGKDLAKVEREMESLIDGTPSSPFYQAYEHAKSKHLYSPLLGDFVVEQLPVTEARNDGSFLAFRTSETKITELPGGRGFQLRFTTTAEDSPLKDLDEASNLWKVGHLSGKEGFNAVRSLHSPITLQAESPALPGLKAHTPYPSVCLFGRDKEGRYTLEITIKRPEN
jgi:hypothetical protein